MKVILGVLAFALLTLEPMAQITGHKPEAEIARMTAQQRVEEHCREYVRHGLVDTDYGVLIERYLYRDGLEAVPYLAIIISEYDPAETRDNRAERAFACATFLPRWMRTSCV